MSQHFRFQDSSEYPVSASLFLSLMAAPLLISQLHSFSGAADALKAPPCSPGPGWSWWISRMVNRYRGHTMRASWWERPEGSSTQTHIILPGGPKLRFDLLVVGATVTFLSVRRGARAGGHSAESFTSTQEDITDSKMEREPVFKQRECDW